MSDDRHDRVRRRAYEMWEQQGGEHGCHEDHWHRASAEIDGESGEQADASPVVVAAPDGTTLTVADETVEGDASAKPARKRAAPIPAAATTDKAPPKPRKPKAK